GARPDKPGRDREPGGHDETSEYARLAEVGVGGPVAAVVSVQLAEFCQAVVVHAPAHKAGNQPQPTAENSSPAEAQDPDRALLRALGDCGGRLAPQQVAQRE